ncbi:MAG: redoxin domain-containing protein [Candidimonas sp.]|nr:MAG: redoxin domain-containing protein [Candidimonas sp.]
MRFTKSCNRACWLVVGLAMVASLANVSAIAATLPQAPIVSYATAGGRTLSTAQFQGHRTMLWLLSTWCASCAAGLQAMADKADPLEKAGLRVVILRNYQNGGYPGSGIRSFVNRVAPTLLKEPGWTFGDAPPQLDYAYNHKHYPDIYFLIDANGRIQTVDGAPAATMDKILRFARGN